MLDKVGVVLHSDDESGKDTRGAKTHSIKEAIKNGAKVWSQVKESTYYNAWKKKICISWEDLGGRFRLGI